MTAPFGAILAGGRSTRYGAPKAFVTVGGVPIVERVRSAVATVVSDLILIANDAAAYAELGLPMRADTVADAGALGGIHAALAWAREAERPGVLVAACDMPFLPSPLLAAILARAENARPRADVVAPESGGRRGVEPLCAYYSTRCIEAIESRLAEGARHVIGFWSEVEVARIPVADVRAFGDPEVLFMNVNTPAEREAAEMLARSSAR